MTSLLDGQCTSLQSLVIVCGPRSFLLRSVTRQRRDPLLAWSLGEAACLELTLALMMAVTILQHCVLLELQDTEFCLEELSNALLDLKAQG